MAKLSGVQRENLLIIHTANFAKLTNSIFWKGLFALERISYRTSALRDGVGAVMRENKRRKILITTHHSFSTAPCFSTIFPLFSSG